MKIVGILFIALGAAAGVLTLGNPSPDDPTFQLLLAVAVLLVVAGVFFWRLKLKRSRLAPVNHFLRAVFLLVVVIPVAVFMIGLLPTFVASFFLPPGESRWVMYGVAALVTPWLLWAWWVHTRLVLSRGYRKVEFCDPAAAAGYLPLPGLPKTWNAREVKTKMRRKGTTKAKWRSFTGHVFYMTGYLMVVGLTKIPLLGLLFQALKAAYESHAGAKLDALSHEVKRLEAPTLEELLEVDSRPPVLLLRSFLDDAMVVDSIESEAKNTNQITFEELLCREAIEWGPVVTIGDPDEGMPQLGAARAYFTYETWREPALSMLENASVVLMVMGKTPSVCWELERILEKKHDRKTVVVFPPDEAAATAHRFLLFQRSYERVRGVKPAPMLKSGHWPLAVAFGADGAPLCIAGPHQVSMAYADALDLASKVLRSNRGGS